MTKKQRDNILEDLEHINPFNVDDDLQIITDKFKGLKEAPSFNDIEAVYNEVTEKFETSCIRYKIRANELNVVIYKVLKKFIKEEGTISRVNVKKFIEEDLGYESSSTDAIQFLLRDSLGNLKCTHLIKDVSKTEQKKANNKKEKFYKISFDNWFMNSRYKINNKNLLSILTPILVEYVKSSLDANAPSFFKQIDSVLEYVLQPYENHNENFELEKYFLDNIDNDVSIRLIDYSGSKNNLTLTMDKIEIHTKIITIKPIEIVFGMDEKHLVYSDENNDRETVRLSDIVRVQIYDTNIIDNIKEKAIQDFSCVNAYITDKDEEGNDYYYICNPKYLEAFEEKVSVVDKLYTIILELPLTALEFFKIKPLNNMKIYATADEIAEFADIVDNEEFKDIIDDIDKDEDKKFKIKDSFFYVIANDTINNATSIVLDTLSDIKIIGPRELKKRANDTIMKFQRKNKW